MEFSKYVLNLQCENRARAIHPPYLTERTITVHEGLQRRAKTAHLYKGNQARKVTLKVKHETDIHSVRIRPGK